jgi:PAS domain S-box-containing protein
MDNHSIVTATVLLISNDAERRQDLLAVLEYTQQTVIETHTLSTGLMQLNEAQPDLVVIDIEAEGSEGYLICENIRHTFGSDAAVLAVISSAKSAPVRALAAGADDCVLYGEAEILLRQRVRNLLRTVRPAKIDSNEDKLYRQLFNSANDAIFVIDLNTGRFLDANRRAIRWLGYSMHELLEMHHDDLEAPLESGTSSESAVQELTTHGHFIFEQGYRTKKGTIIPVEVSSRVVKYEGRRAILNFARDVSKRKQIEDSERRQRKLAEALWHTATALSSTLDLNEVVQRVLIELNEVIVCETSNIMLLPEDGEFAHVAASRGYEKYLDGDSWTHEGWSILSTGSIGWIYSHKKPLIIEDTQTDPLWTQREEMSWIRSYIGVPILNGDKVIGFINLDHPEPRHFTQEAAKAMMAFAGQASIAIQNARLHEKVRQHAGELEARVESRTEEVTRANRRLKEQIIERQRIEQKLVEERNLMRTLIDHIPDEIYVQDLEGRLILFNKALEDRLKPIAPKNEPLYTNHYDYLDRELADQRRKAEEQIINSGVGVIDVPRVLQVDDEKRHRLHSKLPVRDSQDKVTSLVGINRDVTDLQQATAALEEERNLLRTLIDNIPDEIWVKDLEGRYILANAALTERIKGRAPENEVLGSTNFDYVYDDYTRTLAEEAQAAETRLIESGKRKHRSEVMLNDPQCGQIWFDTTKVPLKDAQGRVMGIVGISHDITEDKRAQERLDHIIRGAYCLLWYANVEEKAHGFEWETYISNEEAAQAFLPLDVSPEQTYLNAWQASIDEEESTRINRINEEALHESKQNYSYEYRCHRADGEIRWLRQEIQARQETPGHYSVVGVCTDVTDSKRHEENLRRTNEILEERVRVRTARLTDTNQVLVRQIEERNRAELAEREQRILAEALSDAAAALSETLEINQVLDRVLTYAGRVVPPHQVAGILMIEDKKHLRALRWRQYSSEGMHNSTGKRRFRLDRLPLMQRLYDTHRPVVIQDVTNHPDWINVFGQNPIKAFIGVPIQIENRVIGFITLGSSNRGQFTQNHAHRLQAFSNQAGIAIQNARLFEEVREYATELERRVAKRTKELEYERALVYAILNAMTEGVIYFDDDHIPQYINQSLVQLTGYEFSDWLNMKSTNTHGKETGLLPHDTIAAAMRDGIWRQEATMYRKNGEKFDANIVTTAVKGTDDQTVGAVTVIRDISAEKRLEAQKTRFIANASHELRTPLTNLKTRLYLIKRQPLKIEDHLGVMSDVVEWMRRLVDDLLDVSRFEHGLIPLSREETVIQEIIHAVIEQQQPEAINKRISIAETAPQGSITVMIDPIRITQVVTNLVTNAINYTPDGGRIDVETKLDQADWLIFEVKDTGIGIPEHLLPDVFKPFVRVGEHNTSKGTGLGLSISKEIIEAHGGEILVSSAVGDGTTFIVKLPLNLPEDVEETRI